MSTRLVRYIRRQLLSWGRANFSEFPWRHAVNPFHSLVAEILLQRTRADQVVQVYYAFVQRFPSPGALGASSVADVSEVIFSLGLHWRARYLVDLGRRLVELDNRIPEDIHSLSELPGVGSYAAAAYLSLHVHKRAPIIDSNVVRLYGRFFGFEVGPETRRKKEMHLLAECVTPSRFYKQFNYALIDVTRLICKPHPHHDRCPLVHMCENVRKMQTSV